MKTIIALALCLISINAQLVNMGSWTADKSNRFAGMSIEELRQYTGTYLPYFGGSGAPNVAYPPNTDLPTNFDPRTDASWSDCIHPIRDQQQCGSCWAFGASESFSDRVCIATGGAVNVVLSSEDLVSCDTGNYGCGGGYLAEAWNFIQTTGLVSDSCFPYSAGNGTAPACQSTCSDGTDWVTYQATNVRSLSAADGQTVMFTTGPIETAFDVYEDFFSYTSGVYVQNSTEYVGGHAIKVIGYGVDNATGLNYWLAANSWGAAWGLDGFFMIAAGQCNFDSQFIVGDYANSTSTF